MADPSQMTDEELKQVVETGIEPEEPETPAPTEEEAGETAEPVEEQVEETPVAEEKEPEENGEEQAPQPSRREQRSIDFLVKKYGNNILEPHQVAPSNDRMDYAQQLEADPEVVKQLEADRQAAAQQAYQQGQQAATQQVQYNQFYNNIRFDLPLVSDKLSKLDPEDVKSIDEEYLAITGANPQTMTVRNANIGYA